MKNQTDSPEEISMRKENPVQSITSLAVTPILAAAAADSQGGGVAAWKDKLIEYIISHSGALISAAFVMVVGFVAARWIGKLLIAG